jgi:hypothetical protein
LSLIHGSVGFQHLSVAVCTFHAVDKWLVNHIQWSAQVHKWQEQSPPSPARTFHFALLRTIKNRRTIKQPGQSGCHQLYLILPSGLFNFRPPPATIPVCHCPHISLAPPTCIPQLPLHRCADSRSLSLSPETRIEAPAIGKLSKDTVYGYEHLFPWPIALVLRSSSSSPPFSHADRLHFAPDFTYPVFARHETSQQK